MSEVKRYYVNLDHGTRYSPVDGCDQAMNKAEDFDRVTAERDRLDTRLSCMSGHVLAYKLSRQRLLGRARARELLISELQQRLTAADERANVLEGLLRLLAELPGVRTSSMWERVVAALKPADTAKCERCGCSTVETCDERGCGYLGAGNGAPE